MKKLTTRSLLFLIFFFPFALFSQQPESAGASVETVTAVEVSEVEEVPEADSAAPLAEAPEIDGGPETEKTAETHTTPEESPPQLAPAGKPVTIEPSPKVEEEIPVIEGSSFYSQYIKDRLSIGTRVLWYSLTDTEKGEEFDGSFLGSINKTTEDQDLAPVYLYIEYAITPYFGLGISYDQFKVKTLDSGGGDGTFELDGPILYAFGRFENGSAFTPFGEIGMGFYSTSFNALEEWTFSGGSPTVVNRFEVDDTTGFVMAGGLDIEIIEHLSVNIYLRYTWVDFDVDYFFTPSSTTTPLRKGTFPGDHFSYGIGLKYTF